MGTDIIGVVQAEALRRLGVEATGVVSSTAERAACPTYRDGHIENVPCDAMALSNRERRRVAMRAGSPGR